MRILAMSIPIVMFLIKPGIYGKNNNNYHYIHHVFSQNRETKEFDNLILSDTIQHVNHILLISTFGHSQKMVK